MAKQKVHYARRAWFDKLTMTFMAPVLSKVEGKDEAQHSRMTLCEAGREDSNV